MQEQLIIIVLIRNLLMLMFLLWLENLRQNLKLLSLKLMIELELLSIKFSLAKVTLKIGQEKYVLIPFWKLILGLKKLKIWMEKKWLETFMKKNCYGVKYIWVVIQKQSHIRIKVKVVLDLSNYATKKEWTLCVPR